LCGADSYFDLKVLTDPTGKLGKAVDLWTPTIGSARDRRGLLLPHGKDLQQTKDGDLFRIEIFCYPCFVNKMDLQGGAKRLVQLALFLS
jgi:hypothetical protein